ncbi:MAG: hypothetical protein ACRD8U_16950 [Pyrinomonadaceae bacterium]
MTIATAFCPDIVVSDLELPRETELVELIEVVLVIELEFDELLTVELSGVPALQAEYPPPEANTSEEKTIEKRFLSICVS